MTNSWLDLEGKVVIVTGGASGIGSHICKQLKAVGANVVISDLSVETGEADGMFNVKCDITKKASVDEMAKTVIDKYGRIDALVNNAGVNKPRLLVDFRGEKPEYELDEKDFDFMVNVNQKGLFLCTQAVVRYMIKAEKGVIVNISSEAGMEGSAGQSCYAATKGAVNGFTRSWAKELGPKGIKVVGVAPGINEPTGLTSPAYNEALAYTRGVKVEQLSTDYSKVIPLGRPGKLDDIGNLVTYLVSERSSYISGTTVNISGGKSRG